MTIIQRWILCSLLAALTSCGGGSGNAGETCLAITESYSGTKSGTTYLKVMFADGGHIFGNAPSIQVIMAAENGATHCVQRGPGDISFTATAWIDVSGADAANCADMSTPQCQPSSTDPMAQQSGVERYLQVTQIQLNIVDPP